MNYNLNNPSAVPAASGAFATLRKLRALAAGEERNIGLAFLAILANSGLNLVGPFLVGYAIDAYVVTGDYGGIAMTCGLLLAVYLATLVAGYLQTTLMGGVGQRVLFNLRNAVFDKLQQLPIAFFNQNKAGDLISRINNDTDKLNQFFSQSLMQFVGSVFAIAGAGVFLLCIHPRLGLAALAPALLLLLVTRALSPWIKRKNAESLRATGGLSAEIQESLQNFRVIVAFNRRDYFRRRFSESNENNYRAFVSAGLANNVFAPVYGLCSNVAQLIVLTYGIYLISAGEFTVGLLISFLSYVTRFYDPIRQMAQLWTSFQTALAAWDRVSAIMAMTNDMPVVPDAQKAAGTSLLEFRNVHFAYPDGKTVLHDVTFGLEPGKTYALVGPTGGGKTTTASLMARLYDPTRGTVSLRGRDIRSYEPAERAEKIGFILQEPFLFTGTVRDNILYGNARYRGKSASELDKALEEANLGALVSRFEKGLDTPVTAASDSMSLGQKQLIAFMRAVLRHPDLLILDEATANIDTVTEQLLEDILRKLPATTTRVIIAHRLNTIENADAIFFVNAGEVTRAGSMKEAVAMLLEEKRGS